VSGVSLSFVRAGTPVRYGADSLERFRDVARAGGLALQDLTGEGGLRGCLACAHPELYTQKDFPRPLGIGLVVAAAFLAPFTSYLSLAAAAGLDAALYLWAPSVVVCYACHARHRGFAACPRHPRFNLGIAERLRFGERAVMGAPMRPGGTADAPDPEH
jgi:hypothetical protein